MSKKKSLKKLSKIFDDELSSKANIFYRNSFALCCYLMTQGEVHAAKKQLKCLLDILGWDSRRTYFWSITDSFEEHAVEYAYEIGANTEINKLFRD